MLPRALRVRSHSEFTLVTRTGRKARCGSVVVFRVEVPAGVSAGSGHSVPASRAGLIVGRAVGNSVARHRVSRQVRAALAECLPADRGELVVVRALDGAAQVDPAQLRRDVASALQRLRKAPGKVPPTPGQVPGTAVGPAL